MPHVFTLQACKRQLTAALDERQFARHGRWWFIIKHF